MYSTLIQVDSLPQSEIDSTVVYELLRDDFFRLAGTRWSYMPGVGWFINNVVSSSTSGLPYPLVANKFLQVNPTGTEYIFVDPPESGKERRYEHISNVSYCGIAPLNTNENTNIWNLTKIVVSITGTTLITHAIDSWINHVTANYQ